MVYEKTVLMSMETDVSDPVAGTSRSDNGAESAMDIDSCDHCQRPKTKVKCMGCGHMIDNCRTKKPCPNNHKHLFLMDLNRCPKCHGSELVEFADICDLSPIRKRKRPGFRCSLDGMSFNDRLASISEEDLSAPSSVDSMIAQQSRKMSKLSLDSDGSSSGSDQSPAKAAKPDASGSKNLFSLAMPMGRGRGRTSGRIVLKLTEEQQEKLRNIPAPSAPPAECKCNRANRMIVCTDCGWSEFNARKNIPCLIHPGVVTGTVDKCGECDAPVETLDEI